MKSLVKIDLFLSPHKQPVVVKEKEISIIYYDGEGIYQNWWFLISEYKKNIKKYLTLNKKDLKWKVWSLQEVVEY